MKRIYLYAGVAAVVVVAVVLLVLGTGGGSAGSVTRYDNVLAPSGLISQMQIPNNISNRIGIGMATYNNVHVLNEPLLTENGKPEILYMGAEYCPFCAAERWGMVIALMRFGNFSGLRLMTSSADDYSPSTPTFTFYNSTYYSPYVSFVSVEETTNNKTPLQQPTSAQAALFNKYDYPPYVQQIYEGGIPFILFANRTFIADSNYNPLAVLHGRNWSDIASQLHNTSSLQAGAIIGTANLITAEICMADNYTPSSVCAQPYVKSIEALLG